MKMRRMRGNWDQCWCRCEASPPTLESPAASASQSPLHTGGECYGENEEEEFKKKEKKKKEFSPAMRNQRRGKGADEASEVEQKVKRDREGGGRAANTILVLKQIFQC